MGGINCNTQSSQHSTPLNELAEKLYQRSQAEAAWEKQSDGSHKVQSAVVYNPASCKYLTKLYVLLNQGN